MVDRRTLQRNGCFPPSDGMSRAQGIRADPFSDSPTIHRRPRTLPSWSRRQKSRMPLRPQFGLLPTGGFPRTKTTKVGARSSSSGVIWVVGNVKGPNLLPGRPGLPVRLTSRLPKTNSTPRWFAMQTKISVGRNGLKAKSSKPARIIPSRSDTNADAVMAAIFISAPPSN